MKHPYPTRGKALTPDELRRLFSELNSTDPYPALIARTQYEIAGRVTEVLHLKPTDIGDHYISVRSLKKSSDRRPSISDVLLRSLRAHLGLRTDGYVFAGVTKCQVTTCEGGHLSARYVFGHVHAAAKRCGIPLGLCKTHVLRHTAMYDEARRCRGEAVPVQLDRLKRLSGHKVLNHLLVYLTDPVKDLQHDETRRIELEELGPLP